MGTLTAFVAGMVTMYAMVFGNQATVTAQLRRLANFSEWWGEKVRLRKAKKKLVDEVNREAANITPIKDDDAGPRPF